MSALERVKAYVGQVSVGRPDDLGEVVALAERAARAEAVLAKKVSEDAVAAARDAMVQGLLRDTDYHRAERDRARENEQAAMIRETAARLRAEKAEAERDDARAEVERLRKSLVDLTGDKSAGDLPEKAVVGVMMQLAEARAQLATVAERVRTVCADAVFGEVAHDPSERRTLGNARARVLALDLSTPLVTGPAPISERERALVAALEKTQYALRKAMNGECCAGVEHHADDCPAPRAMSASIDALSGIAPAPISERERALVAIQRWPVVLAFASAMVRKLDQHAPKKGGREGWRSDDPMSLLRRVAEETVELEQSIGKRGALDEAADVANMAMMVADADGELDAALAAYAEAKP